MNYLRSANYAVSISAIATLTFPSFAAPPTFLDARSFAMAGTGVAVSSHSAASYYNPALLAINTRESQKDFGLILPSLNVTVADEDDVFDQVDDFKDDNVIENFEQAVDDFISTPNSTNLDGLTVQAVDMQERLRNLDQDVLRADLGAGFSLQFPQEGWSWGVFASGTSRVIGNLNDEDSDLLDQYIADADDVVNNGAPPSALLLGVVDDQLDSNVRGTASAQGQLGLSFAKTIMISDHPVALGVSPKVTDLSVYDLTADVNDFDKDDIDSSERLAEDTAFNLDLGLATTFGSGEQWIAGLAIINLIEQEVETNSLDFVGATPVPTRVVKMEPLATAGIGYLRENYTLTIDLDLSENTAFGDEQDQQFVRFGTEYEAASYLHVRGGIAKNVADSSKSVVTAGLGMSLFGFTTEFAALYSSDEYGASLQLGSSF